MPLGRLGCDPPPNHVVRDGITYIIPSNGPPPILAVVRSITTKPLFLEMAQNLLGSSPEEVYQRQQVIGPAFDDLCFAFIEAAAQICLISSPSCSSLTDKDIGYLPDWHEVWCAAFAEVPPPQPSTWKPVPLTSQMVVQKEAMKKQTPQLSRQFRQFDEVVGTLTAITGHAPTPLMGYCMKTHCHEVLTRQLATTLLSYLVVRCKELHVTAPIVEAGAGSGRLSHFLNASRQLPVQVIAVDDHREGIPHENYKVVSMDQRAAIALYKPQIIICSWMPFGEDWTAQWRHAEHVQEYILLGGVTMCGRTWETYGVQLDLQRMQTDILGSSDVTQLKAAVRTNATHGPVSWKDASEGCLPPFVDDGFEQIALDDISRYQLQRHDRPDCWGHSQTFSFRRLSEPS